MSKKELKTNAMRILDRNKIPYEFSTYECEEFTDGIETADKLGLPHEKVYKTLVTTGKSGGNAACQRDHPIDRLCKRRLHGNRDEKAVSDGD